MNIDNKQYGYKATVSSQNPYLDVLTFTPTTNPTIRLKQEEFLVNKFIVVLNTVNFIHPRTQEFQNIFADIKNYPSKYKTTSDVFVKAFTNALTAITAINNKFNNKISIDNQIFIYGVTVFNEKIYEDVNNGVLNVKQYVDAMLKMGASLERYAVGR